MKLYKFYSKSCLPCKMVSIILNAIEIPKDVELIEIDVEVDENKSLVKEFGITAVPTLCFDNGKKLIGLSRKENIINFVNGI